MNKLGRKNFNGWILVKKRLHYTKTLRTFNTGEIWWCAVGENVGSEICGKGRTFARPVVIVRNANRSRSG